MNFDNLVVQIFVFNKRLYSALVLRIVFVENYHRQLIYVESRCLKIEHFYGEFDPGSG